MKTLAAPRGETQRKHNKGEKRVPDHREISLTSPTHPLKDQETDKKIQTTSTVEIRTSLFNTPYYYNRTDGARKKERGRLQPERAGIHTR